MVILNFPLFFPFLRREGRIVGHIISYKLYLSYTFESECAHMFNWNIDTLDLVRGKFCILRDLILIYHLKV